MEWNQLSNFFASAFSTNFLHFLNPGVLEFFYTLPIFRRSFLECESYFDFLQGHRLAFCHFFLDFFIVAAATRWTTNYDFFHASEGPPSQSTFLFFIFDTFKFCFLLTRTCIERFIGGTGWFFPFLCFLSDCTAATVTQAAITSFVFWKHYVKCMVPTPFPCLVHAFTSIFLKSL